MNEIVILERTKETCGGGLLFCYTGTSTGTIDGDNVKKNQAAIVDSRRADRFIHSFLIKVNKSVDEYD